MPPGRAYRDHLRRAEDLVTTYEATRAGFVALALEKNRMASPVVEQARALKIAASQVTAPTDLLGISDLQLALLTSAGVSDKAAEYLNEADRTGAIEGLISNFLEPAGAGFVEELVFRFLLTRGDSLGGSMRNLGGELAKRRLSRQIIGTLSLRAIPFQWFDSLTHRWLMAPEYQPDLDSRVNGLTWSDGRRIRTLVFNRNVSIVRKNVDLCLLNTNPQGLDTALKNPAFYLALGELKGGIDPQGADEHWKTAGTSLNRIRAAFASHGISPSTFFVGAAIVQRMAVEIWSQLESGTLANAANLTEADQAASLCRWICIL